MTLRGVNWAAVGGGTALGAAILAGCVVFTGSNPPLTYARLGLVALAAAAAFVLDEPAAAAVDAAPTTLRRRTVVRLSAVAPPLAVWAAGISALDLRNDHMPTGHLLVEGVGVLAVTVSIAAVLRTAGRSEPGDTVATVVGGAILGLVLFNPPPRSVQLFPVSHGWAASTALWCSMAVAAAIVVVAASSRDPVPRSPSGPGP